MRARLKSNVSEHTSQLLPNQEEPSGEPTGEQNGSNVESLKKVIKNKRFVQIEQFFRKDELRDV